MNVILRKLLERTDRMYQSWLRRRQYAKPADVEEILDLPYLPDGEAFHKADVFRPKGASEPLPVAVWLHGGGLVLCDRTVNRPVCAEFAARGFLVFNVDYPVAPRKEVCGILEDVCRGLDWVWENLERFGGDRGRVFLVGDSAGAFLGLYAVAARKNGDLAKAAGVMPTRFCPSALGWLCGMFHTAEADDTGLCLRSSFYGKRWRSHPIYPYLKPEKPEVASTQEPTFLLCVQGDKLRRSSLRLHRGLQAAGVPAKLLDYPGRFRLAHDFPIMDPTARDSAQVLDAMAAFFREHA